MSCSKTILSFCGIILLIFSCKKPHFKDLAGSGTLGGVVILYDTLFGNYAFKSVSSIPVYLRKGTDSIGYLYSTLSSSAGQYSFSGIDPSLSYTIYGQLDSNGIKYYGQIDHSGNTVQSLMADTLKLYPSFKNQNGLFYHVMDSLGYGLANATIYVFASKVLWNNFDSTGAVFILKSDNFGRAVKLNLAPGPYFVHGFANFGNLHLKGSDSTFIKREGITSGNLVLK